jgi:predicted kinase
VLLSSDVVRRELAGIPSRCHESAPYDAGIYSAPWTERTYAELLERAGRQLGLGRSVVIDASWADPVWRDAAARVAERTSSDLAPFRCVLPDAEAERRLPAKTWASDADPAVAARGRAPFVAWPGAVPIDTSGTADSAVAQLLHRLQPWPDTSQGARSRMLPDRP